MLIVWILFSILAALAVLKALYVITIILAIPKTGGALFCTTHRTKISFILDKIEMKEDAIVVDLGCGDGRFLTEACKRYRVRGIGYEINLFAYCIARLRQFFFAGKIKIRRENFWNVSLKDADIVFCYLFPDVLTLLAEKARNEMKKDAVLISCNFPLAGWSHERMLSTSGQAHNDPIYVYRNDPDWHSIS